MLPLIGLGIAVIALVAFASKKSDETTSRGGTGGSGWSIALQGPAALPQSAIPELLAALNINNYDLSKSFLTSPQAGMNVLTTVSQDVMPSVGLVVTVQGVPLTVYSVQPAPIS